MRIPFKSCVSLVALALSLGAPQMGVAQNIGVVASVTPQMSGQAPGEGRRILGTGLGVVAQERIETGANGRGQLLFLDETSLTVASSSSVVLDRFVYDPNRGAGEIGLSITRGALRFIGGAASDQQDAQITTPTGTIGIRGSSVLVLVDGDRTIAVFVAGDRLCFSVLGGAQHCTNRRGGVLSEDGYLGQVTPEQLAQIFARIDGVPPGTLVTGGGAGTGAANRDPGAGPVSTRGATYDPDAPEGAFVEDLLRELLGETGVTGGGATQEPPDEEDDDGDMGGDDDDANKPLPGDGTGGGDDEFT